MTRNFEEEYKRYADNNVPDLWDRIEKAIDEKEVKKSSDKKKITVFVSKYSGIAIAAACVLLSIGALRMIKSNTSHADSAAMAPAAAEAAAEAPAEEKSDTDYVATAEASEEAVPDMDYIAGGYDDAPAAAAEAAEETAPMSEAPVAEAEETDNAYKTAHMNLSTVQCTVDDVSSLEKDHKITVSVKDPLGSKLTAGSVLTLTIEDELYDDLSPILKDGRGKDYEMLIDHDENTDEYRLFYAEIKK